MHPRAEEFVAEARERYGFDPEVREFPEGTETAADAAAAIGCAVAHIASSIAVRVDDELVVVITSGANRVDLDAVAALRGRDPGAASMADPDAVRGTLGWSIGGVPPLCHETEVPTYLDETLLSFERVWAAAGTPQATFPIDPERLRDLAGAVPADVADD
jgi:prolyl-tRNA editing enzyme YbaK/EbsC (Cys-tRNA(Pro) deacylase)